MPSKVSMPSWLLVIFVVTTAGFSFMVGQHFDLVPPNTNTYSTPCGGGNLGPQGGIGFNGFYGGGQFPSQSGTGNGPQTGQIGEIFEKTNAYYSWTDQGQGEAVLVEGQLYACGPTGIAPPTIQQVKYHFTISTDLGISWHEFRQTDDPTGYLTYTGTYTPTWSPSGWKPLPTGVIRIHGVTYQDESNQERPIVDGAWLRVDVDVSTSTDGTNLYGPMASDILQLHSGLPAVQWTQDLYQIGQTATVHVDVPALQVGGSTAYYLTILNMNTNSAIGSFSSQPVAQLHGQSSFTVTASMFDPGNINRLRAVVSSQIFNANMQDTATIDNTSLAPILNSVTWNKPLYREGDLVVINITASPNPVSKSPIVKYYVLAHVGGIKYFDGFSTSSSIQFTAANAGPLTVEATAIDQAGRSSGVGRYTETVGPAIDMCVQYPNLPECNNGGGGPISALLLLIYLGLIVTGFVLFFIGGRLPNLIAMVLLRVGGALLILVGVFLATPLAWQAITLAVRGLSPFG